MNDSTMPKTKQVKKKSMAKRQKGSGISRSFQFLAEPHSGRLGIFPTEYESVDEFLTEVNTNYEKNRQNIELDYERACKDIRMMFMNVLQELPDHIKCSIMNTHSNKDYVADQNNNQNASVHPRESTRSRNHSSSRKRTPSVTLGHVPPAEGLRDYVGDKNKNMNASVLPRESSRAKNRSTSRKRSPSVTSTPPAKGFKTPLMNCRKLPPGTTITPKIYNDSPMTIMRRPLHGEIAVSMDGSPLLVAASSREDIPTVNIPVEHGKIFSIVPEIGQPLADLPQIDHITKEYLKILSGHLQVLVPNTP
ncbi:hypothetical protein J6590_041158 [Homalodisca vitripennis]|nr:hypothetical protein J6590_041158 [Homalodisca vitripennis]